MGPRARARGTIIDRFRRNAILLWTGQFVSQMGDAVFVGAVAWLAASLAGSPAATGSVVFLAAVPFLLFGPFAGAWVDRADRRRILVTSDLVRAAILLGLPLAAHAVGLSFPLLAVTTFLLASASTPFLPARDALLPRLAEGRSLLRFNAAFQTSGQLAQLLGLWLGGALLGTDPQDTSRLVTVLALDGATFLVSALTLAALRLPPLPSPGGDGLPPPPPPSSRPPRPSLFAEARDGLATAARDRLLVGLLVLTALDNLAIMGPAIVGATHFVKDDLRLGAAHAAWFEGSMALGFLLGALVLGRFGTTWPKGRLILLGMLFDGLTYVPFFWVRSYPLALALVLVHGMCIPAIVVARTSLLQQHVGDGRAGKVFALVHLTVSGMTALSAVVAGAVAARHGAPTLFLLAGGFGAACGLAGLVALPRLRDAR